MMPDPHPWATALDTPFDRHAPSRNPTLATVSPDGKAKARTVAAMQA
jgi:hypothetical protein